MQDPTIAQMTAGLAIGIISLIVLILRTKIHAFPAMIIAAILTGLVGGMPFSSVMKAITDGFGSTLGSIGIVIGLGIMMGEIFEISGAAKRMAQVFIKMFGKNREDIALGVTGFLVSIPIFCDSGFVILAPLAKAISRNTGKCLLTLGISLAGGLVITHHLVPPTPGPIATAAAFKVPLGDMVLWGFCLAIPCAIGVITYARYIGTKIFILPALEGEGIVREPYANLGMVGQNWKTFDEKEELPSTVRAFAPIIVPIIFILIGTFAKALGSEGMVASICSAIGHPIVAVGFGLLIAIYTLTAKYSREDVVKSLDRSVSQAGIILLVTGAGGALGAVLRTSGAGDAVAAAIANLPLPAVFLPITIATIVRLLQGSGTVAMITAASIVAPMADTLGLNPVIGALACSSGAFIFSYFNDSYFWVVNRILGISDVREQIRAWSVTTTICWAISCSLLVIANIFFV